MTEIDERREVAARLRTAAKTKSNSTDYLWNRLEIAVNGWRFGDAINDSYTFDNDVLARLADLIEPTTRTTTFTLDEHSKDGEEVYPTRWWKCARCGEETIMLYDEGEPVACPYCKAVVDDDTRLRILRLHASGVPSSHIARRLGAQAARRKEREK